MPYAIAIHGTQEEADLLAAHKANYWECSLIMDLANAYDCDFPHAAVNALQKAMGAIESELLELDRARTAPPAPIKLHPASTWCSARYCVVGSFVQLAYTPADLVERFAADFVASLRSERLWGSK